MGCAGSSSKPEQGVEERKQSRTNTMDKYSAPKVEFINLLGQAKGHIPRARKFHQMISVDDHSLFVIGGLVASADTKDSAVNKVSKESPAVTMSVNRFSVRDFSWHHVTTEGDQPSSRGMHTCVNYQGDIYMMGNHLKRDDQLYRLKGVFGKWLIEETSEARPPPTAGHSLVVAHDTMWMFGGESDKDITNNLYCYEFPSKQWTLVDDACSEGTLLPRRDHSAVVFEELMLVFGGFSKDSDALEFMQFSATTKQWSEVIICSESQPEKRGGHSCELYHQYMIVFGGMHHKKMLNDLWVFDVMTSIWTKVDLRTAMPPARRCFAACALAGPYLYFHGGGDDDSLFRDLHRVDANELVKSADPTFVTPDPGLTEDQRNIRRHEQVKERIDLLTTDQQKLLGRKERRTQHFNTKYVSDLWSDAMNRSAPLVIH